MDKRIPIWSAWLDSSGSPPSVAGNLGLVYLKALLWHRQLLYAGLASPQPYLESEAKGSPDPAEPRLEPTPGLAVASAALQHQLLLRAISVTIFLTQFLGPHPGALTEPWSWGTSISTLLASPTAARVQEGEASRCIWPVAALL